MMDKIFLIIITSIISAVVTGTVTGFIAFFKMKTEISVVKVMISNHIEHRLSALETNVSAIMKLLMERK